MTGGQRLTAPLLVVLCGCLLIAQVLIRPAVGLSNNNDFAKMAGPLALGPETGDWTSHVQYGEFVYRYVRDDRYWYDDQLRTAQFLSSEFFFVKLARGIQRIIRPGPRFDIRWLGAVHGLFFLLAIGIWVYALPPRWRLVGGLLAIFVWTDVAYVEYLNTFYMDAAGMIFLLMCAAAALRAFQEPRSWAAPLIAACAAILFAASKTQHAIPGLIFVPAFLGFAFCDQMKARRAIWAAGALLLPAASYIVLARAAPAGSQPLYTVVFWRIARESSDPLHTLEELGLGKNDLPYVGTFAYSPNAPLSDPDWTQQFRLRVSYASVARYYFRHPGVALRFLYRDLSVYASRMQPFANLSPDDGFRIGATARNFRMWSDFRSFLFRFAPWHILVLISATLFCTFWLLSSHGSWCLAGLALAIQLVAIAEYVISVLADASETSRHLMMFHAATEISILLLPMLISEGFRLIHLTDCRRFSSRASTICRDRSA